MNPSSPNSHDNVNFKGILIFLILLALLMAGTFAVVRAKLAILDRTAARAQRETAKKDPSAAILASRANFPPPREQVSPGLDLKNFRLREDEELNTYGWIDRKVGIVRIPIGRAIELISERGLPARATTNINETGPSRLQLQQDRATEFNPSPSEVNP